MSNTPGIDFQGLSNSGTVPVTIVIFSSGAVQVLGVRFCEGGLGRSVGRGPGPCPCVRVIFGAGMELDGECVQGTSVFQNQLRIKEQEDPASINSTYRGSRSLRGA